jgi:SAM-dependent methyltransferase
MSKPRTATPHLPRFLAQLVRVLRPGGYFPYADLRPNNKIAEWEADLAEAPLRQLSQREIKAKVLHGIEKISQKSRDLVDRHLPGFLRFVGREYIGMEGTRLYRYLESGDMSYRMYCFIKG